MWSTSPVYVNMDEKLQKLARLWKDWTSTMFQRHTGGRVLQQLLLFIDLSPLVSITRLMYVFFYFRCANGLYNWWTLKSLSLFWSFYWFLHCLQRHPGIQSTAMAPLFIPGFSWQCSTICQDFLGRDPIFPCELRRKIWEHCTRAECCVKQDRWVTSADSGLERIHG